MANPFDLVQLSQELGALPDAVELALKKLAKRDSSTKLKGLDELSSVFRQGLLSDWNGFWQRFLTLLLKGLLDPERRVRMGYARLLAQLDRRAFPCPDPKFQYAVLGALDDPVPSIRSSMEALFPKFRSARLDWQSLQKEAADWLQIKADRLHQALAKDCESIRDPAEKDAALALANSCRQLALHRALSVLSALPAPPAGELEAIEDLIARTTRYRDQGPALKNAILTFHLRHGIAIDSALLPALMAETAAEVVPTIIHLVGSLSSVEFLYNIFNCAPFELVGEIVSKLPQEDAYDRLLWPACRRFQVTYDERKIKFMFDVMVAYLSAHSAASNLLPDFFVRSVVEGEAPFGVYGLDDALRFFPDDYLERHFLSANMRIDERRQANLLEVCMRKCPESSRAKFRTLGRRVDIELLKRIPSLLPEYLADRPQIQADLDVDAKSVINAVPDLELLGPLSQDRLEKVLEFRPSLLSNMSRARFDLLAESIPAERLFGVACQIDSIDLAMHCMSGSMTMFAGGQIPSLWFRNAGFGKEILVRRLHFLADRIDKSILGELITKVYLNDSEVGWQEVLELLESLEGHVCLGMLELPILPPMSHPEAHLLPRVPGKDVDLDADRLAKLVLLADRAGNRPASLSPHRFYLKEEHSIDIRLSVRGVCSETLLRLSREHGNFYALGLEECHISTEIVLGELALKAHPHHTIVMQALWSAQHPKEALQKIRDSLFFKDSGRPESLECLLLAASRARLAATSDIISRLLGLQAPAPLLRLAVLRLLSLSNLSPDFLRAHADQVFSIVDDGLRGGHGVARDLALDCVCSYQVLQTAEVMRFVLSEFASASNPSAAHIRCARIAFASEPFDKDLILRLMGDRQGASEPSVIQALLMARFLFILGHDQLIAEIGCRQNVPPWFSDVLAESRVARSSELRNTMAWEMMLGLAENCRGGNARDDSIAMDRMRAFLQQRIDYAVEHIFAGSSPSEDTWMGYDVEGLSSRADLGTWAGNLLYRTLRLMPPLFAAYRDHEQYRAVLQRACVLIQRSQLGKLRNSRQQGIRVTSSSTQTDVQCEYQFEDAALSLHLKLPANFPLQPPEITLPKSGKLAATKTKNALLAARSLLLQRCDLLEGLQCWRASLDASFAGVDPCSICYCVMCPQDGGKALPGPSCKTCHHRFHPFCLYRWFKTSGGSSCPMCRSLF